MNDEEFWAGLEVLPVEETIAKPPIADGGDEWLALLSKGVATGVLSFADIPKLLELPYQLEHGDKRLSPELQELVDKYQISLGEKQKPSLFEELQERLRPKPDTPAKRIAANAAEFVGGSLVPMGPIASSLKGTVNGIKGAEGFLNTAAKAAINPITAAATVGGTSGGMQEMGVNPLVADVLAAGVVPSVKSVGRGAMNLAGLHPDRINTSAALAARNLGIDLPADVLSDSALTKILGHSAAKSPLFAGGIKNEQKRTRDVLDNYLSEIVGRSGIEPSDTNKALNSQLYNEVALSLPQEATSQARIIKPTIQEALNNIQLTDTGNADKVKVRKQLEKLASNVRLSNQDAPSPIAQLVRHKQDLNGLDWDVLDPTAKAYLAPAKKGLLAEIEHYGINQNPDWYSKYKQAEDMFGSMANRKDLEKILEPTINYATQTKSSNKTSKILNKKKTDIKKLIRKEDAQSIDDLAEVEKALYQHELANPNKSGTATTMQALNFIDSLTDLGSLGMGSLVKPHIGGAAYSLVNNQHLKNAAINRALNPKQKSAFDFLNYYPVIAGRTANRTNND